MRKMASNIAGFVIQRLRSLFKNGSPGACGIVEEGMAVGDCASSDKAMTFVLLSDSGRSENGGSGYATQWTWQKHHQNSPASCLIAAKRA